MGQTVITHAPERLVICARSLTLGCATPGVITERMRVSKRDFRRGLPGDFRPLPAGGPRRLLPLV